MADRNPGRALEVVRLVEMMCDFIESPATRTAVDQFVPVTMPRDVGSLGFDVPLWAGLGTVGLWAALDAFAERADLPAVVCTVCNRRSCIQSRFVKHIHSNERVVLAELEDLRHLYAHNYAGDADDEYLARPRHVLRGGAIVKLTCGAQFDGRRIRLTLSGLRAYVNNVRDVLTRFS